MILAGAALAGIPPVSGFFSKEAIIGALAELHNPIWLVAALGGVFLTTYYTFRLIFIILFPSSISEKNHQHHTAGSSYWCMAVPLLVLAGFAVTLGFFMHPLEQFLIGAEGTPHGSEGQHTSILIISLLLEAAALALAWYEYGRAGASQKGFVERLPAVRDFFEQRWYLDHLYRFALDTFIYRGIAALCQFNDRHVIDGTIDGLSRGTIGGSRIISWIHGVMIQYRLLIIFMVIALIGGYAAFNL